MPDRSSLSMRVRVMRLLLSWVLVAIGVPLLVRAGLGVAPFDVLNTGVADVTGLSFGTVFILDGLACFAIGTILGARPGPASWVGGFVIGALINVSMSLIPEPEALVARIPMLIGGISIIAAGICSVISTDLGAGPSEVVMLGLIKHRVGVVVARWVSDGVPMRDVGFVTVSLWIDAPSEPGSSGWLARLLDSHPPIEQRIAWLRSLERSGTLWTDLAPA